LFVEDLADGGNARGAWNDYDEGGGFAVEGGEDAGCWAGVGQFSILINKCYRVGFYFVVAGKAGLFGDVEGDISPLLKLGTTLCVWLGPWL